MIIDENLLKQIEYDLGLSARYVKGSSILVKNVWHFSTDGNRCDAIFFETKDFEAAMNRIFVLSKRFKVIILAFVLMDNHIHFVLYGELNECYRFINEYKRLTSIYLNEFHGLKNALAGLPVSMQVIDTDDYLRTVICYVMKNPPVAGLPFNSYDYPWSSGSLYFRNAPTASAYGSAYGKDLWTRPAWMDYNKNVSRLSDLSYDGKRQFLNIRKNISDDARTYGKIVFPGDYVAFEIVERIFRSKKSFNFFLCRSKEEDVESRGGAVSNLSIPDIELRQYKNEMCKTLFGNSSGNRLSTNQRIKLAKHLRAQYNCSVKSIARVCGLKFDEIKNLL